jgi:hypothetical protein
MMSPARGIIYFVNLVLPARNRHSRSPVITGKIGVMWENRGQGK